MQCIDKKFKKVILSGLLFSLTIVFGMSAEALTVVIDPGHGGKDPGAFRYSVKEKDLALNVAKKLKILLEAQKMKVVMTRSTDITLSLEKRAEIANKYKDSLFVSIHFNAAYKGLESVKGIETFYVSYNGKRLASTIQSEMVKTLNSVDRKVKKKGYKVLEETNSPAVLVECGFISNYSERQHCSRSWYQSLCASAIAKGIITYNNTK